VQRAAERETGVHGIVVQLSVRLAHDPLWRFVRRHQVRRERLRQVR